MDAATLRARLLTLHATSPAERRALRADLLALIATGEMPERALAAAGLGRVGDAHAVPALVQALADPAPLVQWQAAHALQALHAKALVPMDRPPLPQGSAFTRWQRSVLTALADALHDRSPDVRREAAFSLAEIADPSTVQALVAGAIESEDPVCWEIGHALLQVVRTDPDRIADAHAVLVPALHAGDPWTRQVAAGLIAWLGNPGPLVPLLSLLHDPEVAVRRAACAALGQLQSSGASGALLGRLADDDSGVRQEAALALGRIGDRYAVPALKQLLGDEVPAVRAAVAEALARIEGAVAQPVLLQVLRDADPMPRLAAIRALGDVGGRQALRPLDACARDRWTVGPVRLDEAAAAAGAAIRARMRGPAAS